MYGKKMKMAYGGLTEQKAKRPNDYDGNEKEADELQKELETENFAHGGMSKKKMAEGGEVKDKKGAVMAIVARLAKKPTEMSEQLGKEAKGEESAVEKETEGMEESSGMMEAKMAAADELMGAMKSGDKQALVGALENFMRACSYE